MPAAFGCVDPGSEVVDRGRAKRRVRRREHVRPSRSAHRSPTPAAHLRARVAHPRACPGPAVLSAPPLPAALPVALSHPPLVARSRSRSCAHPPGPLSSRSRRASLESLLTSRCAARALTERVGRRRLSRELLPVPSGPKPDPAGHKPDPAGPDPTQWDPNPTQQDPNPTQWDPIRLFFLTHWTLDWILRATPAASLWMEPREIVRVVRSRMEEKHIRVRDARLNGSAASHVLHGEGGLGYKDLDLIFCADMKAESDFQTVKDIVLDCLLDFLPDCVNKERITPLTLK
ncbi:hypothetical protein CRUP_000279, partial [Coryphaenoides rupestris]